MMLKFLSLSPLLLVAVVVVLTLSQSSAEPGQGEPDSIVERLSPHDFPSLPQAVSSALDELGCSIPQPFDADDPANVIIGRFIAPASMSQAALCSREGISAIVVFGNEGNLVAELAPSRDAAFMQTVGPEVSGYSRRLQVVNAGEAEQDGIADIFIGKASTIFYLTGERWVATEGLD